LINGPITIPIEFVYLAAGLLGGGLAGWSIERLISGRRLWALHDKFLDASNALAAANADLTHMQELADRLEKKEVEIREFNERMTDMTSRKAELENTIANQRRAAEEKAAIFEETRNRMVETFSTLSARALKENNASFMDLAQTTLSRYVDSARSDMETRSRSVREFVKPMLDCLEKYDHQVQAMEQSRQNAYGGLSEQVVSLSRTQQDLAKETGKLVQALRLPHVRGRWGELTLRRVVEIAGMQNRCDFYEQPTAETEDGALRPDMVVKLPGNRQIVIDAKVPITAYLDSLEADTGEEKEAQLCRHAGHVQRHIANLAQKAYWNRFTPTPEFVVLFMPGENFFSAALAQSPGLIEEGAAKGVILATPTTLISLLKTVSYAWRQEAAVENARAVSELGNELYSRIYAMVDHFNKLGRDLDRCVLSYNRTLGSLEKRVLVSARRFQEMGAVRNDQMDLDAPAPVEQKSRQLDMEGDYESTA